MNYVNFFKTGKYVLTTSMNFLAFESMRLTILSMRFCLFLPFHIKLRCSKVHSASETTQITLNCKCFIRSGFICFISPTTPPITLCTSIYFMLISRGKRKNHVGKMLLFLKLRTSFIIKTLRF